jgi:hypothetical protein
MTTEFNRLWAQVEHDIGFNDHNMRRDRPYNGQPHTCTGTRGATEIRGITFRDLRDCFIRAYIRSHPYYVEGTITPVQPNAALSDEADRGENAAICEIDVYKLQGSFDPIAVVQNLCCEVERIMGIFPNVPALTQPPTNRHTG